MTAKSIYEAVLTELNKQQAPSITLEDFNHFFNKAINQFINKKYNIYDVNQQSTDDLRVLKATTMLTPSKASVYGQEGSEDLAMLHSLYGATYEINLPDDYLHILNCICVYKVNSTHKCYNSGDYVQFGATRLVADAWGQVINNFYMKPSYKRPYYYIHNVNTQESVSTNPIVLDQHGQILSGTDFSYDEISDTHPQATQYVYHECPRLYDESTGTYSNITPPAYTFSQEKLEKMFRTPVTSSIKVQMNKALTYLLVLPENVNIKRITEEVTGDQTILYSDRLYPVHRPVTVIENGVSKPYKLIFLGRGSQMSGNYTITLYG